MKLLVVLTGFAVIAAINLPGIIKRRIRRELIIYSTIFVLVFVLAVLVTVGVRIPSPIKAIQAFYRDVLHMSFKK